MSQVEQTAGDRAATTVAPPQPEYWVKRFGKLVLGNLVVLVMCITLIELYFGSWFSSKPSGLLCDVHFRYKSIYGFEKTIHYDRDFQCLRGPYNPLSIDVITVGSSTTDQRYLTEGETWQDSIARYFNRNGRKLSIANAGVDGQSTIGNLWNFEYWFPKLSAQPKFYLFYIGGNDIYRLSPDERFDDLVRQQPQLSFKKVIKTKSALYQLYKTISGIDTAKKMGIIHTHINFREINYTEKGLLSDYSFYGEYLHREFIPRLDALVRAARQLGSESIFVTHRSYFWRQINGRVQGVATAFKVGGIEINGFDRFVMEKAQIEAILNFCKDRKLICIDAAQAIGSEEDFYDFGHNTPHGAEKLGAYIGERLLNEISALAHSDF